MIPADTAPDVEVMLTLPEFVQAVMAAMTRIISSAAQRINHASTYDRDLLVRLNEEVVGVCSEMAFAKWRRCYWSPPVNTFHHEPDVEHVEVRGSASHDRRLIVRDNDDPMRPYVFVTGHPPSLRLRGWIRGEDARRDEYLDNPHGSRPAWFVPPAKLHRMPTLSTALTAEDIPW